MMPYEKKGKSVDEVLSEQHKHVHKEEECATCKKTKEEKESLINKGMKYCENCKTFVQPKDNCDLTDWSCETYCPQCGKGL